MIAGPSEPQSQIIVHPRFKIFASVGTDKFLRIYSYESFLSPFGLPNDKRKNCLINTIELTHPAKSCDISSDGKYFAVGYDKGVFEVFHVFDNDGTFFQLECLKLFDLNRQTPISCVRFTPDCSFLVITCHKDIVVFNAQNDEFDKVGLLKGNTS